MRSSFFRSTFLLGGLALVVLICGCDPPVVGFWRSDKKLGNGKRSEIDMYSDQSGDALLYATPANDPNTWYKFKFDVFWEEIEGEFELDLDCTSGPCEGANFDMTCDVVEDENDDEEEKLDCSADRNWRKYPMQFERNEG